MFVTFVAVVATSLAFLLNRFVPKIGVGLRSVIAGLLSGLFMAVFPMFLVMQLTGHLNFLDALLPMVIGGLFLGLVIGIPTAFLVSRRWSGTDAKAIDVDIFK
ncbi:MAG: hypothetical protein WBA51_13805 [Erythrobacter sp.]